MKVVEIKAVFNSKYYLQKGTFHGIVYSDNNSWRFLKVFENTIPWYEPITICDDWIVNTLKSEEYPEYYI